MTVISSVHPFAGAYSDQELASLSNCVVTQFGFRQGRVTPEQIGRHGMRGWISERQLNLPREDCTAILQFAPTTNLNTVPSFDVPPDRVVP
jgi:hypothetical protein